MAQQREIENLVESSVKISGSWDSMEQRQLWAKNELTFRSLCDWWKPAYVTGKNCMNYVLGKIFDDNTRSYYENIQHKICIEPRVLKPRINSIVGQIIQSKRTGKITAEKGALSATDAYRANVLLKFIEKEIHEQQTLNKMLFTSCVTGCPSVLKFDQAQTASGDPMGGIVAEALPWDSCVLSPFTQANGEDVTELIWLSRQSKAQMIDENPDKEEDIKEHYQRMASDKDYSSKIQTTDGLTIEDSRYLYYDVVTGLSNTSIDGRALVLERWFITKEKLKVAIASIPNSIDVLDYQIIPKDWNKARRESWMKAHPGYKMVEKDVKVLWQTRWTREGLNLMNEIHWFQEADNKGVPILPIGVIVPQMIDGVTSGPGPDDQPLVLMKAIVETEALHDIRLGANDLLTYIEGHVVNAKDLPTELSRPQGIAVIDGKKSADVRASIASIARRSEDKYLAYSSKIDRDLVSTDLVSASLMGQQVADQSAKAKGMDIAQGMLAYSFLSQNFNESFERIKNLECMLIPYCFTEEQVIQIYDEDMQEDSKPIVVNEAYYDVDGVRVINPASDLSGVRWRYRLTSGDDSPTARQQEMNELIIFWNTTAPALIEADPTLSLLASMLMSMKNNTAKDIGKVISEKASVQAEQMNQQQIMESMADLEEKKGKADAQRLKALRAGFSFSITPEDLVKYPQVYQMLVAANYINPMGSNQFQYPPGRIPQDPATDPAQAVQV